MTIPHAFEVALHYHQAGRLAEAEALYRAILAVEPRHADALHLLGVIAHQVGRHDIAMDLIRQAIALAPGTPDYHSNLSEACRAAGQLDEAIAACRQAIVLKPDFAEVHYNHGNALRDRGQPDEAIAAYRQAIALKPDYPKAYSNLGNALRDKGELDEAVTAWQQAIALKPDYPEAHSNLGNAFKDAGELDAAIASYRHAIALQPDCAEVHSNLGNALRDNEEWDAAIAACRQAITLKPNFPEAHCNLGNALRDKGQLDEAIAAFRQAVALKPNFPVAHNNLGNAFKDAGKLDAAIASYRQAIALQPDYAEAYSYLGNALRDRGQPDEAIAAHRQAIALKPDYAEAHSNLGNALTDKGELDEAIASYREAIALNPARSDIHGNLLLALNYHPGLDAHLIAEEHRRWNRQHAEPLWSLIQPHSNHRDPERRLRIGYVSPDFREHAVARFLLPLLANHDREAFEISAYAQVLVSDAMTQRLRNHTEVWRSLVGLSDRQAAELIRQDGIDILVDLTGHTAHNRLMVFARKPAPVQVTWLGYPNTTGLEAMDYRLTDALADPPGLTDLHCSEKLIRLARCAWCFKPDLSPPAAARKDGPITFGSFNNFAKVNATTFDLWARILHAVPDSRLLLKSRGLGSVSVCQGARHALEELGIAPGRLELRGYEPHHRGHLALYERTDIALDTSPYHGTTTTCEALWMGVPVVSLAGNTHVSRVGVSLLSNVALPELVATSHEQYIEIATSLAQDLPRLARLRATLRQRMAASPLTDAPRFARDVEAAFRQMWRQWCLKEEQHTKD